MSSPSIADRLRRVGVAALGASVLAAVTLTAEPQSADPVVERGPFDGLVFREIGPATPSGRIDDFAVFEADPDVFYVATATGGLWKTVNHGTTFRPVFDGESTSSIGAVAIFASDPNVVWVGTGENNNRQSSSWGDGVYKSTDGGRTWRNMGLRDSRHIARIIIDPVDPDTVYVAAQGSLWGSGGERGIYRTTDGGATWARTLHVDDDTGATELVMDPSNRKVLYAATYQRRRAAWGMNGGGPGSGIHKSTDGGETWVPLTGGIPAGDKGRIGLDVYRRDPDVIYARIEHPDEGGVYRSDDGGAQWRKLTDVNPRPMYFSQIRVDPQDDSRIYVLGTQLHVSDDGGRTFREDGAERIHVDFHAMWIDPADPEHLILGGDGGVAISHDRSESYVYLNNLPLGQFYHVSYDMQEPYTVCGGLQDNNTWCGPSAVRSRDGIANDDWFVVHGGDGFVAQVDPTDPRIIYAESQNGRMSRIDRVTNERQSIQPAAAAGEDELRWNWDTPLALSPHDPSTVFVAANRLFRSTDRGYAWTAVSPDLTRNVDRDEIELMGVPGKDITIAKNDGVSAYSTLTTFAESPRTAGIYWTGSDDGLVQVSRDAGGSWTDVTSAIAGVPEGTYVSRVAPSRFEDGRAYVSFDGHRADDFTSHAFVTEDFGRSWQSIVGDLPAGEVVRTITEDLRNPDVLYVGTERGLFVTVDRGRRWHRVKANLPTVPIYEIALHPRDNAMLLATHGRSIWVLDDLTPVQQFAGASRETAHLFEPPPATHLVPAGDRMRRFEGDRIFLGTNPEVGAVLTYLLAAEAGDLALVVTDGSGARVRVLEGEATKSGRARGLNRLVWDLRVEPVKAPRGSSGGGGFGGDPNAGPMVLPGTYTAALQVDGRQVASTEIVVGGDPAIAISDEDRQAHVEAGLALHALHGTANEAADAVTAIHEQLDAIEPESADADVPAELRTALEETRKRVDELRRRFGVAGGGGFGGGSENVRGAISRLKSSVLGATARPTETQLRQIGELESDLAKAVGELNGLIEGLPALYSALTAARIFPALPSPIKPIS